MDRNKLRVMADAAPQGGGDRYLKVPPGESADIVLVGDPEGRVIVWDDDGRSRPADKTDVGAKVSIKILQEVYLPSTKTRAIWECGLVLWRQADKLREKLPRWALELTRTGQGMLTRWAVTPARELTPEEVKAVAASKSVGSLLGPDDTSLEVWESWKAQAKGAAPAAAPPADEEIPF